ncbi:MAG: hypothetical protein ACLGSH_07455 [Acidobacteriota bacterium]
MNTAVIVSAISAASAVAVAAVSFYLTKSREREADWRKYKFEHYKEFLVSLSRIVGQAEIPEGQRMFAERCNTLYLIGTKGVLDALHAYRREIRPTRGARSDDEHNRRLSALIWEIRKDVGIPGTPDLSDFIARLWRSDVNSPIPSNPEIQSHH